MKTNELITKLRSMARYVAPPARELLITAADELERMAAELMDERRWIPVEERLPEPGKRVLASDGGFVGEFYISNRGQWKRYNVNDHSLLMALDILWWMPLPESPKE